MSTPTFQRISVDMFERLLRSFHFSRQVNAVHMHHTWRPRHADFKGHDTIVGMWAYHTGTNGWSDIAQHITIDPEGMIWLGRNWNLSPASASGHNGNSRFGPFMFEMIGDFDRGRDPFEGRQKEAVVRVIAAVQERFGLAAESLRFHNMMSAKSCPGSALDFRNLLDEVNRVRVLMAGAAPAPEGGARSPFPGESEAAIQEAMRSLQRVTDNHGEPADAEHDSEHGIGPEAAAARGGGAAGRPGPIGPAEMAAMRPHFINLSAGMFSDDGAASSTAADVDAIFEQHLQREIGALAGSEKLRIVLFAHGGLVPESAGLETVRRHLGWWQANGVYPIFFIWETGFWASVRQLIWPPGGPAARGIVDRVTDRLIERAARKLRGPGIWGSMKRSAERAAQSDGGSRYAAVKLVEFCGRNPGRVELHAIGHSAGSIFHAHFLPLLDGPHVPKVKSLHLLAPAIRVDACKQLLIEPIRNGKLADHVTVYTMHRDVERADNCSSIYRKSLLYLIHHALEARDPTPLLGLEDSLRGDAGLKAFFGLAGERSELGEVIWSPTVSENSRSSSRATAHGDFDDDRPTMHSVARRVLGLADATPLAQDFPLPDKSRGWADDSVWPQDLSFEAQWPPTAPPPWPPAAAPAWPPGAAPMPPAPSGPHGDAPSNGRRIALCVGIDAYPDPAHRLGGCVNDARNWAAALTRLGFQTRMLLDGQATRQALASELEQLVTGSRAGDVIVFQFAGHGTHVPDLDGDEADGQDEALCPVDFARGALYIDDDIAQLIGRLPDSVNLTLFTDCCHSGTNSRFAVGLAPGQAQLPAGVRARHVVPTAEINEAHRRFRAQHGNTRAAPGGSGGAQRMRDVKFAACLDHQVALESAGSGDFTQRALRVLERGIQGLSHERFLQAVISEFGAGARQEPLLDCAPDARQRPLLQPLGRSAGTAEAATGSSGDALLLQTVNALAQSMVALTSRSGR